MAKGHIGIRFTNESFKMRRQPPNPKRNFPFYMLPPCLTQQEGVARDEDLLVFLDWFLVQIFLLCFVIVVGDSRCSFWVFSSGYGFGRLCLPGVCDMIYVRIAHWFPLSWVLISIPLSYTVLVFWAPFVLNACILFCCVSLNKKFTICRSKKKSILCTTEMVCYDLLIFFL